MCKSPIFSPNSADTIQSISIPSAAGYRFFVMLKNNLLFAFNDKFEEKDEDVFLSLFL